MHEEQTSEIDLVKVIKITWVKKFAVVVITVFSTALSIGISYLITPIYQAEVVLAPVSSDMTGSEGNMASNLGGLASIVGGIGVSSADDAAINMATFQSRKFIREFITENNLIPVLYADRFESGTGTWVDEEPTLWEAVNYFELEIRSISVNQETGMITLLIDWTDPEVVVKWAEGMVTRVNNILYEEFIDETRRNLVYLNEQVEVTQNAEMRDVLYRLIQEQIKKGMLSSDASVFAYKVVDPAEVPEKKISPKRIIYAIVGMLIGGLCGVIYAWVSMNKLSNPNRKPIV